MNHVKEIMLISSNVLLNTHVQEVMERPKVAADQSLVLFHHPTSRLFFVPTRLSFSLVSDCKYLMTCIMFTKKQRIA